KVVRQRVRTSKCNHHSNQSDDSQKDAHHGRRDGKNEDEDMLLYMRVWTAVAISFSFHTDQFRPTAKPAVQTITALIGKPQDIIEVAFEIHKPRTTHGDRREFVLS